MPKQLYIPLPCSAARAAMIERQLGPSSGVRTALSPADVAKIVEKTAGYSGKTFMLWHVGTGALGVGSTAGHPVSVDGSYQCAKQQNIGNNSPQQQRG